jgi:sensor domain CHASE-containing protein
MHRNTMHPQMKSYTKYDVALFVHEHGKTRWKDLLQAFVENRSDQHISQQLLSDYLNELCAEGLVNNARARC